MENEIHISLGSLLVSSMKSHKDKSNQIKKSNHLFYPWIVSSQSWYVHVNTRLKTNY